MSLNKILQELRSWRALPSQRARLAARPLDKEVLDPTPMALPVGYEVPPTMTQLIQRFVRQEVSQAASDKELGTFDDEDDFSVESLNPLPMEQYSVNEYDMADDPDMPGVAPVEDPPSEDDPVVADPSPNPGDEPTDPK